MVFVDLTHHVSIMNGAFINHKWLSALTENDLTNTKLRYSNCYIESLRTWANSDKREVRLHRY